MEKVSKQSYRGASLFLISIIVLIAAVLSTKASATSLQQAPGMQLAAFYGYHVYDGRYHQQNYRYPYSQYYHAPRYNRMYWTGWRYIGYGCEKRCLVKRHNGVVVRCTKRC